VLTPMAEPLVPLGEIVTTHGLHGWLKLNAFNPTTSALCPGVEVFLAHGGRQSVHHIEASSQHKKQFLIKLRDINSIEDAARYVGSTLAVGEAALEALEPRQYYHYQIVGFEVYQLNGNRVGTISSTLSTPGGELYVVQGVAKEHLIPAVREIIEQVDFDARKIIINPPEGLLDL
jgi:16S rRNA processing protein RimM